MATYTVEITLNETDDKVLQNMAKAMNMTPEATVVDIILEDLHDAYIDFGEDEDEL